LPVNRALEVQKVESMDYINIITEWPVIIQGALGSGLFWIILLVGNKGIEYSSLLYSKHSINSRYTWLTNRAGIIELRLTNPLDEQSYLTSILLYRASRFLFKALMWLVLGLALQLFLSQLAIIGYLGCLYYLISGYNVVGGTDGEDKELSEELDKINIELESIELGTSNKPIKQD
jgi:hypothetical protein